MSIYKPSRNIPLDDQALSRRLANQVIIYGSDETLAVQKGAFFLEYLEIESGKTVTIKDGAGTTIATGVTGFANDHSPLRCDGGISFTGDVILAKGFVVEGIFIE